MFRFWQNLANRSFCVGSALLQRLGSIIIIWLGPSVVLLIPSVTFLLGAMLQFEIGDKVIYPNHGLGVVDRIETKTILGTTCGFYSLRMISSDTTVLVPVDNVEGVGLRCAIGDSEIKKLFTLIRNGKIENHQNWKGRFKDNSDKMRTGSIYDVIEVLKSLNHLSKSKNLSFREKRMLDRAKFLVVSEMSEVMSEASEAVEARIDKALDRCLANRARQIAKAKVKKASSRTSSRRTARAS